jgi:hypothetical protein
MKLEDVTGGRLNQRQVVVPLLVSVKKFLEGMAGGGADWALLMSSESIHLLPLGPAAMPKVLSILLFIN